MTSRIEDQDDGLFESPREVEAMFIYGPTGAVLAWPEGSESWEIAPQPQPITEVSGANFSADIFSDHIQMYTDEYSGAKLTEADLLRLLEELRRVNGD